MFLEGYQGHFDTLNFDLTNEKTFDKNFGAWWIWLQIIQSHR